MNLEEIKEKINNAIVLLKQETPCLNFGEIHERTTAHRLAVHIEKQLAETGWNVDCEYNKDGTFKKELDGISACSLQRSTDTIYPDIIIHHRLDQGRENNLLVIELKRGAQEDVCDRKKLELLTKQSGHYKYQFGLYLNINRGGFNRTWYLDGVKQS